MIRRIGFAVGVLTLLAMTGVSAQQVVTGRVVRIDQPAGVIVLDNGQMYQTTAQTVVLVDSQPTAVAAIAPGTPVVLQSAQPVFYRDGRYIVMTHPAASPHEMSGVVRWVMSEPGKAALTFEDGRHIWIDESTQVLANGAPAMMSTLQPGTFVTVRSLKPLAFRGGDRAVVDTTVVDTTAVVPTSTAPVAVVRSPAAMPRTLYDARSLSVMPGPLSPEMGLRERENDRQAP